MDIVNVVVFLQKGLLFSTVKEVVLVPHCIGGQVSQDGMHDFSLFEKVDDIHIVFKLILNVVELARYSFFRRTTASELCQLESCKKAATCLD